jgi:DMSO/TMAO reductase YedYZ heme-binding membrane subunit
MRGLGIAVFMPGTGTDTLQKNNRPKLANTVQAHDLGLFAFFYAVLHFLVYIILDLSGSWSAFKDEVPDSPYILMGLLTFFLMIPLAVTSTKAMQKRLGANWKNCTDSSMSLPLPR